MPDRHYHIPISMQTQTVLKTTLAIWRNAPQHAPETALCSVMLNTALGLLCMEAAHGVWGWQEVRYRKRIKNEVNFQNKSQVKDGIKMSENAKMHTRINSMKKYGSKQLKNKTFGCSDFKMPVILARLESELFKNKVVKWRISPPIMDGFDIRSPLWSIGFWRGLYGEASFIWTGACVLCYSHLKDEEDE